MLLFLTTHMAALTSCANQQSQGGYSHTLLIRVCAAQRGCDFEAPDLEQGILLRGVFYARKLQFCKQPFELIQGQIAFKNMVQCINKQTVVLLFHPVL